MKPEDINKQLTETQLEKIISKEIDIVPETLEFTYQKQGETTFVWMDFDSDEGCLSILDMARIKCSYRNQGYKVENVVVYPLADCRLSFRMIFEF